MNKYLQVGLLFNVIFLISSRFSDFPELLNGLFAGLAISFMLFGAYAINHDVTKFQEFKRRLFIKQ